MSFRRTWDVEYYAQKAKERQENGDEFVDGAKPQDTKTNKRVREEFQSAEEGAEGPMGSERAFLKARQHKLELDEKAGKIEIINPTAAEGNKAGFWCEVCSCLLKDSASYLSHINGKKHQSALGFSMRVERANVDTVKDKLEQLKAKVSAPKIHRPPAIVEYQAKLDKQEALKQTLKQQKKEEIIKRKELEKQLLENQEEEDDEIEEIDPDLAAMMGFQGFGTTKKK